MKYLKRFNENENLINSYKKVNGYHSLVDNGFDIKYHSDKIEIKRNTNKSFEWEEVESDFIPLLEQMIEEYNIFDNRVNFIAEYEDFEMTIEDIINELNFPVSVYDSNSILSIEVPFKNPIDNQDFVKKLISFFEKIGFEDIEEGRNEIMFQHDEDDEDFVGGFLNSKSDKISDFIDEYGYDSYDFSIYSSYIEFPSY